MREVTYRGEVTCSGEVCHEVCLGSSAAHWLLQLPRTSCFQCSPPLAGTTAVVPGVEEDVL